MPMHENPQLDPDALFAKFSGAHEKLLTKLEQLSDDLNSLYVHGRASPDALVTTALMAELRKMKRKEPRNRAKAQGRPSRSEK